MAESSEVFRIRSGVGQRAPAPRGGPARLGGLLLFAALGLGACSFQFGSGSEPQPASPEEANRERNRLYQQEQLQLERQRQFDRVGPSDR